MSTQVSRRSLLLLFVAAGVISGAAAVLFHEWVLLSRKLLLAPALGTHGFTRALFIVGVPLVTAAILGFVVERFAPSTVGANLARVRRSYAEDGAHLDPRTIISTFILTPLSLGSGAPLGPEGPTVVVTSGLSVMVARLLGFPRKVLRGMVPVGTAAGIAAIFRTPITGVVFALEELFGTSSRSILGGTLIAAVAAAVVQQAAAPDNQRLLPAAAASWTDPREMIGFAVVGVFAGLVSGVILRVGVPLRETLRQRVPSVPLRFAIGGAAAGILGLVNPAVLGVGYETTSFFLRGGGSLLFDAEALGAKAVAFTLATSTGLLGGTFAPSLFLGAALGALVGHAGELFLGAQINTGAYALVGMGAFFAGTLRAPIAAVLIVIELTNDYGLIAPLMLGVVVSNWISHAIAPATFEEDQMEREGVGSTREQRDVFSRIRVGEVMTRTLTTFTKEERLPEVVERTREIRHSNYPVIDEQGRLTGILRGETIARAVREGRLEATVADLAEPPPLTGREEETLYQLVERMAASGVTRCPVVNRNGVVVGFLSPSDVVMARLKEQTILADETMR
ncbi:MAG TPA: chloride channel protein [Thermoanaerobaculia bacterium]|nr:chloride channel protein [Thermoanaerobaculia bacterium]